MIFPKMRTSGLGGVPQHLSSQGQRQSPAAQSRSEYNLLADMSWTYKPPGRCRIDARLYSSTHNADGNGIQGVCNWLQIIPLLFSGFHHTLEPRSVDASAKESFQADRAKQPDRPVSQDDRGQTGCSGRCGEACPAVEMLLCAQDCVSFGKCPSRPIHKAGRAQLQQELCGRSRAGT